MNSLSSRPFFKLTLKPPLISLGILHLRSLRPATATLEMELMAVIIKILALISDAYRNAEKLPAAMISCGVVEAAAAIFLGAFKAPGGIFQHHSKAPFYLYYGIIGGVAIFGFAEAWTGFWVSGDLNGRRAVGRTILWVSILPLVVAALGVFVFMR
uniref:Uncharacterized protein n=1 Tax=Oryza barthii TaxID=65489 RepID=A0A0D3G0I1_9ORYZ